MFRLANIEYLYLIPLIGLFWVVSFFLLKRTERLLKKYFHLETLKKLTSSVSYTKRRWKIFFEGLVILFLLLAMARLQMGQGEQKVKNEGVELVLAFDVSKSMLAEDMKPSRLDYAKREAQKFLDQLSGHKVGLIVFAGNAVLVSPLTVDYSAVRMYIDSLGTESVSTQGTNYEKALFTANEAFLNGGIEKDDTTKVTRAVVIFSDGEDQEAGAIDQAKKLVEQGVRIFTLGIGTSKGGSIPVRDRFGYLKSYKKDSSGKVIVTKAKTKLLKDLADTGKGAYYHASFGGGHIKNLVADLNRLEKSEFDSKVMLNYKEYFQVFLVIAFILACMELLISERKSKRSIWKGRFQGEYKK